MGNIAKRTLDIVFAGAASVALAPLFLVVALSLKLDSRGPVFYRPERVGRYGNLFRLFKIRTMIVGSEGAGGVYTTPEDDPRVTRMGRWIRRFNLDELPQFINVLTGDMSLVGPRPEYPHYIEMTSPEQRQIILSIRPGITDWATLAIRDKGQLVQGSADPEKIYIERIRPLKLQLQMEYVRRRSFWTDIVILLRTFQVHFIDRLLDRKAHLDDLDRMGGTGSES